MQLTISAVCLCLSPSLWRTLICTLIQSTFPAPWISGGASPTSEQMKSQRVHPALASCRKFEQKVTEVESHTISALARFLQALTLVANHTEVSVRYFGGVTSCVVTRFNATASSAKITHEFLIVPMLCSIPEDSASETCSPVATEESIGLFMLRKDSERRATLHRVLTDYITLVVFNIQESVPQVSE